MEVEQEGKRQGTTLKRMIQPLLLLLLSCFSHVRLCAIPYLRPCSDSSATPSFPSQPEGKIARSGGEKGLRGSGAGTLGVPLGGTRCIGGLLGGAGRLSGTVSPFRAEQGTSLETPSRARASSCQAVGTTWFFSAGKGNRSH